MAHTLVEQDVKEAAFLQPEAIMDWVLISTEICKALSCSYSERFTLPLLLHHHGSRASGFAKSPELSLCWIG